MTKKEDFEAIGVHLGHLSGALKYMESVAGNKEFSTACMNKLRAHIRKLKRDIRKPKKLKEVKA